MVKKIKTDKYILKYGKHFGDIDQETKETKVYREGDIVELSPEQYASFSDKFELYTAHAAKLEQQNVVEASAQKIAEIEGEKKALENAKKALEAELEKYKKAELEKVAVAIHDKKSKE